MASPDKTIQELEDVIADALSKFNSKLPKAEQDMYARVLDLTSELDTDKSGRIKSTAKNIRLIGKIKEEIVKVIYSKGYKKSLDDLVKSYDDITELQNRYFGAAVGEFTVPKVANEIRNISIQNVVEGLDQNALGVNIGIPVRRMLTQAITTGGNRKDFTEQVRAFLLESDGGQGSLTRYAKQITTDALNQYAAQYNSLMSDSLGFEWFKYSGSLLKTSRPFCKELIKAGRSGGCLEYIHISQLDTIISGDICGEQVPIYDKTGLPQGMIEGTNTSNFRINRGGYNCGHQLLGVPNALVPKSYRDKFSRVVID